MTRAVRNKGGVRGGALLIVASFMILSAVVRLAAEAGPVIARSASKPAQATIGDKKAAVPGPGTSEVSPALLKALSAREARIANRERQLDDRLQALKIVEQAVDTRLSQLKEAEKRLRGTLAEADGASERDIDRLTSVYEQMKAKDSAKVFEEMEPEFAAGLLSRMRPEIAASVLEGMDPKAAYTISVVLAGRNLQVPTE